MTTRNIFLAAMLAFPASGCSDAVTVDQPDAREHIEACPDLRTICTEDTVCMEMACRPAFDRDYQVRLHVNMPGRDRECSDEPACLFPRVEVYYSELEARILTTADPKVAEIRVVPGSALIAEHRGEQCVIDLTAERLQIGRGTCTAGGISATLTLHPMPDESDEAAF